MAVSVEFRRYVLDQLHGLGRVTARPMFGGVGLYNDNLFFALLDNDTLYFKVNDATRPRYAALGMKPFCPYPDDPSREMGGYFEVPADVLEDADELVTWARQASEVALSARDGKRRSPPKRARTR
jgi:DNA transformation protein